MERKATWSTKKRMAFALNLDIYADPRPFKITYLRMILEKRLESSESTLSFIVIQDC